MLVTAPNNEHHEQEPVKTNQDDPIAALFQNQIQLMVQQNGQQLSAQEQEQLKMGAMQVAGLLHALQDQQKAAAKIAGPIIIIQLIISLGVTLTFGVLFILFQGHDDHNDYCGKTVLKNWAYACSIMCFIQCGFTVIKVIGSCSSSPDQSSFTKYFLTFINFLYSLNGIGLFACAIGLTVNDSSDCGSLHKLSMAYYILTYIGIGLAVLSGICMLGAMIKAKM